MDKIKELLKELGGSEELVESIITKMGEWETATRTELSEEFEARLSKAKSICLESVKEYKQDLSRRVEIFLESQVASIERELRGRSAIEESKAVSTLKDAKCVLEGVQIDGQNGDLQATLDENVKLRKHVVAVTEDRDGIKQKYQHAKKIANDALGRNRVLEGKVVDDAKQVVAESKGTKLGSARSKKGKTRTTRATLVESQVPAKRRPITESKKEDDKIMSIASQVDDVL